MNNDELYEEMLEAAKDPMFIKDIKDTMEAFKYSDAEVEKIIDVEW